MATYVVFAGNFGVPKFHEILGYLHSLADEGAIDDKEDIIRAADVMGPDDWNLWFTDDAKVKDVLAELGLGEHYVAIRARVADKTKLEGAAQKLCERYDIKYGIYNTDKREIVEWDADLEVKGPL